MKYIFTLKCKNAQTTVNCKMFVCSLQYEAGILMAATAVTVVTTRCATSMASPPTPTNTSPCQNWPVSLCHTHCTPSTDPSLVHSFSVSLSFSVWPPTLCLTVSVPPHRLCLTVTLCHPISSLSHCLSVPPHRLSVSLSLCATPSPLSHCLSVPPHLLTVPLCHPIASLSH